MGCLGVPQALHSSWTVTPAFRIGIELADGLSGQELPSPPLLPLDHLLSLSKPLSCSEHQVFSHQGLQHYQATSLLPRAGHSLQDVGSSKREGQLEGNF